MDTCLHFNNDKCIRLQLVFKCYGQHFLFKTLHDTHRNIRTISDDRSISTILIKKSLKEILQISKGMACCLVPNKAFKC